MDISRFQKTIPSTNGPFYHLEEWWSFCAEVWLDLVLHIAPPSDISDVEMIDEDVAATYSNVWKKGREMQKSYHVLL